MDSHSHRQGFFDRHLDPASRLGEVLFGLIMVLSVTLAAGAAASGGEANGRQLLWAAVGCNIAWGIIDGVMYLMNCVIERNGQVQLARKVQAAASTDAAVDLVRARLDPDFAAIAPQPEREAFYRSIAKRAATLPLSPTRVTKDDLLGAVACFWLVFLACLPAALPFLVFRNPRLALRVSNFLLIALLFIVGQQWGRHAQTNPWWSGLAMVVLGLAMVGVAILLGG